MTTTADESTIQRAVARARKALDSQGFALPAPAFWSRLEAEIRSALERNDEREEPVRGAVEEWVGAKALRDPNFAVDHSIRTYEDVAIQIEFAYHKENREVATAHEPSSRQSVEGELEDLWERSVPEHFVQKSHEWRRRGTGEVVPCHRCKRTGKQACEKCSADGFLEEKCRKCDGGGEIHRQDKVVGGTGGKAGGLGAAVVFRTEQCRSCRGTGKVEKRCGNCRGRGEIICTICEGVRELWQHEVIRAESSVTSGQLQLRPDTDINPKWVSSAVQDMIGIESPYNEEANRGRTLAKELTTGRLLHERIKLAVVPVTIATFEWRGQQRRVYLVDGKARSRHAHAFLGKKRVAIAAGAGGLALAVAGWFGFAALTAPRPALDRDTFSDAPPAAFAPRRAVVTATGANIRRGATTGTLVVGQVLRGDTLEITGQAGNGWLHIRFAGGDGYISPSLVRELNP